MKNYQQVIGLEIHVELKTQAKMFCQCPADYFGKPPNSQICPVCLGLPGALPVPNQKAIEWTIFLAKALNCRINKVSKFDRKHYFYPDLAKGYQISQYDEPIAVDGYFVISSQARNPATKRRVNKNDFAPLAFSAASLPGNDTKGTFRIRRVHLEEDTGKLIHQGNETLIDFNRCGVPLVEIVTEPDFDNSDDVKRFLEEIQLVIRYLGISDCDMEKGTMRLEPNISVAVIPSGARNLSRMRENFSNKLRDPSSFTSFTPQDDKKRKLPNYKVEVKNINSFRFVKQAIDYEVERQIELLEKGQKPVQETRGFNEKRGVTYSQRTKEEAHDYRYFPEPDIPPMVFDYRYLERIEIPELPQEKIERYVNKMGLRYQDAWLLTRNKKMLEYFERVVEKIGQISQIGKIEPQRIANLIINKKISIGLPLEEFVQQALAQFRKKEVDEKTLNASINRIIEANKQAVEDYRKGKQNALMFLVGQVMRKLGSKAKAQIVRKKLEESLK